MKKFFLGIAAFLLLLLVPFAGFYLYIQGLPSQFTNTLMGTAGYKYDLLQAEGDAPRILLVGGSSAAYGANCAYLSEQTGRPCIDLGVVYGLGIEFYVSELQGNLREGDIVLFAPEYGMWNGQLGYNLVWCCCEDDPDLLSKIPASYWPHLFTGPFFTYAKEKLAIYNAGSCDGSLFAEMGEFGDITAQRENQMPEGYLPEDMVTISPVLIGDTAVRALNRLQARCDEVGATLLVTYPPVNRLAIASNDDEIDAFAAALRDRLDAQVVGEIRDSFYDASLFYDTNFHLNSQGALERSERLAVLLAPFLA